MKINLKNPYLRSSFLTLSFYLIYFSSAFALEKSAPSGPCTPGAGIMLLILLFPVSIALFIKNVYQARFGKPHVISAIIHFCVFIAFCFSTKSEF